MSAVYISEYPNDLTVRLFAQGYTPEHHPDNVRWCSCGEFEYTPKFLYERVYEMPCGLLWREKSVNGYMSFNGVSWRHENDNPTTRCPYLPARLDCPMRDARLGYDGGAAWMNQCAGTPTDKPYDESRSLDAVAKREQEADEQRAAAALVEFAKKIRAETGSFCPHHARWNRDRAEWAYIREYDPYVCPDYCTTQPCLRCGIRDDGKEGNVLYDIHEYTRREDGSFFDGEWQEIIIKGEKLFDHPRRLAICEMAAANPEHAMRQIRHNRHYSRNLFFEEYHWHGRYRVEAESIRIVRKGGKDVRDLLADLQAVQEGATVVHASDQKRASEQQKRKRRAEAKEKKAQKMEKLVLSGKFGELEPYVQKRIGKVIGADRLRELMLEAERARSAAKPEQMSLFTQVQDEQS